MDPNLIERVVADGGDIYTVVNKTVDNNFSNHSPVHSMANQVPSLLPQPEIDLSSSFGSPKYSHLVHNKGAELKLKPSRPPPPAGYSLINAQQIQNNQPLKGVRNVLPGYEDVSEKKLVLTPVSPQSNLLDNDMWMSVNWQTLPQGSDMSLRHRSSSQTAIDQLMAQEEYANLAEISNERPVLVQQRRHSFSEGRDKSTPRESIIPISNPEMLSSENDDSDTYAVPPDALYGNMPSEEDYINYDAADYSHDYLNEEELREQLRNNPHIPLDEEIIPAIVTQHKVPALGFKDILMENLRIKKPTVKTVIQSSAMREREQKKVIPMFHIDNAGGRGLQVGRGDYMEFAIDSWGEHSSQAPIQPNVKVSDSSVPSMPPKRQQTQSDSNVPLARPTVKDDKSFTCISSNQTPATKKEPPPKPPLPASYKQHRPLQGMLLFAFAVYKF